jgi:hypothetical protein
MAKQDWKKALKKDPTDWLLEEEDSGVRYLALRDIVGADEKEIKAARTKAHREGPIATILDNMNPAGYWMRPGAVYAHKCRGTVWSIISLGQLGASVEEDKRVGTACNYLLDNALSKGGQFSSTGDAFKTFSCLQGNLLTSLMEMGCRDKRLDTAYEWTARTVTGEGLPREVTDDGFIPADSSARLYPLSYITGPLFNCRRTIHCSWAGAKVMMAFSRLPIERRTGLINRAIKAGTDYFFGTEPSTANFAGHRPGKPDKRWWQFHFPMFWVADILQVADALTALGYGSDPGLAKTLELVYTRQDDGGRWPLELDQYRYRMWLNYGSIGKPNKWVTLRAMRVLKQAGEPKKLP